MSFGSEWHIHHICNSLNDGNFKAKAELRDQASKLEELRQQIEESEKRERDFKVSHEA